MILVLLLVIAGQGLLNNIFDHALTLWGNVVY
jgi:hypothetical protein